MEDGIIGFIIGIIFSFLLFTIVLSVTLPDTIQESMCSKIQSEYNIVTAYDKSNEKCYVQDGDNLVDLDSYFGQ